MRGAFLTDTSTTDCLFDPPAGPWVWDIPDAADTGCWEMYLWGQCQIAMPRGLPLYDHAMNLAKTAQAHENGLSAMFALAQERVLQGLAGDACLRGTTRRERQPSVA